MISASDRSSAIELIDEAVASKARLFKACDEIGITERTYYRWIKQLKNCGTVEDLRPICEKPEPANKISKEEREKILSTVSQSEFASMPPCEIVPALADKVQLINVNSEMKRY